MQVNAKQCKAKQSKTKQCKAMHRNAKRCKAMKTKWSTAKHRLVVGLRRRQCSIPFPCIKAISAQCELLRLRCSNVVLWNLFNNRGWQKPNKLLPHWRTAWQFILGARNALFPGFGQAAHSCKIAQTCLANLEANRDRFVGTFLCPAESNNALAHAPPRNMRQTVWVCPNASLCSSAAVFCFAPVLSYVC